MTVLEQLSSVSQGASTVGDERIEASNLAVDLRRWSRSVAVPAPGDPPGCLDCDPSAISYEVDAHGTLRDVSPGWDLFALANGAPQLRRRQAIGRSFWEAFADESTLREHAAILARCRARNQLGTYLFRCDAPFERRLLRMEIRPLPDGGFRFDSSTLATQPRKARVHDRLMRLSPVAGVARCSQCNRFRIGAAWVEAEQIVDVELADQARQERSRIIHTLCPPCHKRMRSVPALALLAGGRAPSRTSECRTSS